MIKKLFLFVLLFVLTILPRFVFLNNVPVAINNDELHYVLNAKSFFVTGKDITGKISPLDVLLFKYPSDEMIQSELPYFLEMSIFGPINFSLAGLALPNAILGILTIALIYLITKKLFDEKTAFVAGFIAALNPWLIFVSRTSYEAGAAIPFFLGILYLLLVTKGWRILLTIPIAFLAFYSYIGTKLIFVPFMFLSILYAYLYVNKRKYLKQYAMLFVLSLLLTLFFVFQIKQIPGARTSEILTPNNPRIIKQVNDMRATTIQNPLMTFSENKYYVYLTILAKNTFNALSPYYLFAGGDYFYLIGLHGIFYYVDVVFLVIGLMTLVIKRRKELIFLGFLIGLSLLPQIFHDPNGTGSFTPHITLLIPFLILPIAFGISKSLELVKNKNFRRIFMVCLVFTYLFLFVSFLNSYFFRFPLQEGTFAMPNRILSKYLSFKDNANRKIVVYSTNPMLDFKKFLFYSNGYYKKNVGLINESLARGNYVYKNITFLSCNNSSEITQNALFIDDMICGRTPLSGAINITQIKDSGVVYRIYNDKICSKYSLPRFISGLKLSDLAIESLSQEDFCKKFIVSY